MSLMLNHLCRFLFSRLARVVVVLMLVAAAWAAWWVAAQRPLRSMTVARPSGTGGSSWSNPALGQERVVFFFTSRNGARIFELDLGAGKSNEIVQAAQLHSYYTAIDLSWTAYSLPDGEVHVVHLSGPKSRFIIPSLKSSSGLWMIPSPDQKQLMIAGHEGPASEVWDVTSAKRMLRLDGVTGYPAFSRDGGRVAIAMSEPAEVGVWEIATGRQLAVIPKFGESIACLGFHPDGRLIVGYYKPGTIIPNNRPPPNASGGGFVVMEVDQTVYTATVRIIAPGSLHVDAEFEVGLRAGPTKGPALAEFSSDGRYVTFRGAQKSIFWDLATGIPVCLDARFGLGTSPADRVNFGPNGRRILINGNRVGILVDHSTLMPISLSGSDATVPRFWDRFSPDGRYVSVSEDYRPANLPQWQQLLQDLFRRFIGPDPKRQVAIFDSESGCLINRIPGHAIVAWTADGNHVWIEREDVDALTGRNDIMLFELRSIFASTAPWWLWLVTVGGVLFIIYNLSVSQQHRISKPSEISVKT